MMPRCVLAEHGHASVPLDEGRACAGLSAGEWPAWLPEPSGQCPICGLPCWKHDRLWATPTSSTDLPASAGAAI